MPAHPIASYTKSARLFALYQCLPRSEADAVSLTELMQNYGEDPDSHTNECKNLENDLIGLNQTPTFTKPPGKSHYYQFVVEAL